MEKSNNSEFWINKISRNRKRGVERKRDCCFKDGLLFSSGGNEIKKNANECVKAVGEEVFDFLF